MIFRDGQVGVFPRVIASDQQVSTARERDYQQKVERQTAFNSGKYVKHTEFKEGDIVCMKNQKRAHKFDPIFTHIALKVCNVTPNKISVADANGKVYLRHPDDLRLMIGREENGPVIKNKELIKFSSDYSFTPYEDLPNDHSLFQDATCDTSAFDENQSQTYDQLQPHEQPQETQQAELRRSSQLREKLEKSRSADVT